MVTQQLVKLSSVSHMRAQLPPHISKWCICPAEVSLSKTLDLYKLWLICGLHVGLFTV